MKIIYNTEVVITYFTIYNTLLKILKFHKKKVEYFFYYCLHIVKLISLKR